MRTTLPTLTAALAASLPLSLAMAAGLPIGDEPPAIPAILADNTGASLESAEQLLKEGKPVAARALLMKSYQRGEIISDPGASKKALDLLRDANNQIGRLDPLELSLQKAQVALEANDVRIAERHAQAVLKSATVSANQSEKAKALIASIEARRAELSPVVPDALAQAELDFLAGRYAQARQGLELVDRSGVPLSVEQQTTLDTYQMKLIALAAKDPEAMGNSASMGVMQPGVVKRREDQPMAQPPATPEKPADKPAEKPAPKPADKPAPAPAPAATQPPKATPPAPTEDPVVTSNKFTAKTEIERADKAYDANNLNQASAIYSRVLIDFKNVLTPEQRQHVENRLQEAKVKMGAGGTAPRPEDVVKIADTIRQQAKAEYESDMSEAKKALDSGDFALANQDAARARLRIGSARQYFPETEYETLNTRVTNFLSDIERARLVAEERARREQEEKTRRDEEEKARGRAAEREKRIVELIDRARAYQVEKRYAEALQAVDQLLFIDPINPTGLLMKDLITDIQMYVDFNNIYDRKQVGYANNSLENQRASIPPAGVVNFAEDWPAISVRRGEPVQFAETPENRKTLADLNSPTKKLPTVAFNNPLQDAVKFLETVTHQTIDVDWASLEEKSITKETNVSLNMTNVTPRQVLDRLVEKVSGADDSSKADWAVVDGQVVIASAEKIRKNTVLVIYDIRDLLLEVPDYRDVPQIDLQQALQAAQGGQGGGGGGRSPFKEENGRNQQDQRRERDQKMDDIIKIITDNVDYDHWVDNGGDTGKIQKIINQGNLIITNTPKNQRLVGGLLSKLREIRAMQINVETRFLLVNQAWFEQIGFNLDVVFNANNSQFRTVHAADPTALPSDFFNFGSSSSGLVRDLTAAGHAVLPPATAANGQNAGARGVAANPISQGVPTPTNWSPIGFMGDSLGLASALAPQQGITADVLGKAPALGIAGQFLDDVQVDFLIRATQADRRSIQLTAPRITFTNGQTSNIYVATQQAFISDLTPVVGDSAVGFDPTVGVVTEGVTLLVEGTVTADRRYVQMNVDAGVARIDGFGQQAVVALAGGQLVNSQAAQQFIQLPKVTVTRVRTTVTVPDQGTILMGGQRLVTESEVETGVPILSKIPIINRFFTNRIESREEQTLLILIKPTILIQNEEEERHFPGLLDSYRAGLGG